MNTAPTIPSQNFQSIFEPLQTSQMNREELLELAKMFRESDKDGESDFQSQLNQNR